jgi:hypothetical protein
VALSRYVLVFVSAIAFNKNMASIAANTFPSSMKSGGYRRKIVWSLAALVNFVRQKLKLAL